MAEELHEIFEDMKDLVAVHRDIAKTFGQQVAEAKKIPEQIKADLQAVSLTVTGLEAATARAEQVAARIEKQRQESCVSVSRAKQWVGMSLVAALLFLGAGIFTGWRWAQEGVKEAMAEYNAAAAKLPDTAKWAVSADGVKAKKLIEMNNVDKFLFCTEKGWVSEKKEGGTYCYPQADEKGSVWGWKIK